MVLMVMTTDGWMERFGNIVKLSRFFHHGDDDGDYGRASSVIC